MENAHADAAQQAELAHKAHGQQRRADALEKQRAEQDAPRQTHDAAVGVKIEARPDDHALAQRNGAAHKERGRRHNRHEAEAADLNEQQDDALAEKRPVERGADRDKSGDAGRARRGKECVKERGCAAAFRRERQHEQQCSRQNYKCKTRRDHNRCVHRVAFRRTFPSALHDIVLPVPPNHTILNKSCPALVSHLIKADCALSVKPNFMNFPVLPLESSEKYTSACVSAARFCVYSVH